jgi:uncharacterized protein (TIGR02118 family)
MTVVAAVRGPDVGALARPGLIVRAALADQGLDARGNPFDVFVVVPDGVTVDPTTLGAEVLAWRVTEHVPKAGDPTACAVTMVSLMRRRPGSTPGEFADHWTTRHAPLALRRHVGLADYHQFVVTESLTPGGPEIDGVAVLGFLTRTDFDTRFFDSDEGRDEIMADVARFMDRPGPETTLVGPPWSPETPG